MWCTGPREAHRYPFLRISSFAKPPANGLKFPYRPHVKLNMGPYGRTADNCLKIRKKNPKINQLEPALHTMRHFKHNKVAGKNKKLYFSAPVCFQGGSKNKDIFVKNGQK